MSDIAKRTFYFASRIIRLCQFLGKTHVKETNILIRQLLRSGTSIGANVEEGQAEQNRNDFIRKMAIAFEEAKETNHQLRLLESSHLVPKGQLTELLAESVEIKHILGDIVGVSKK